MYCLPGSQVTSSCSHVTSRSAHVIAAGGKEPKKKKKRKGVKLSGWFVLSAANGYHQEKWMQQQQDDEGISFFRPSLPRTCIISESVSVIQSPLMCWRVNKSYDEDGALGYTLWAHHLRYSSNLWGCSQGFLKALKPFQKTLWLFPWAGYWAFSVIWSSVSFLLPLCNNMLLSVGLSVNSLRFRVNTLARHSSCLFSQEIGGFLKNQGINCIFESFKLEIFSLSHNPLNVFFNV